MRPTHRYLWQAFILCLVLCVGLYFQIDLPLALHFKQHLSSDEQTVWRLVTHAGQAEYPFIFAGLMIIVGHLATRRKNHAATIAIRSAGLYLLSSLIVAGAAVILAKPLIGRLRPRVYWAEGFYGFDPLNFDYGNLSFPSGHAQSSWTFAICVLLIAPPLCRLLSRQRFVLHLGYWIVWLIIGFAALVTISRVVLTAHWLSDVVMGSFLGGVVPILLRDRFFRPMKAPPSDSEAADNPGVKSH